MTRAVPLPCPFCGEVAFAVVEGSTYRWALATCLSCGASGGDVRSSDATRATAARGAFACDDATWNDAVAEWNRRAPVVA